MEDSSDIRQMSFEEPCRASRAQARSRFFIPQCEPNASLDFIQVVSRSSPRIAFNLWKVLHSKRLKEIRAEGLRHAFGIPKGTEVWLSTTAEDPWLRKYYSDNTKQFIEDIQAFRPDWFEGPDLWLYREDGFRQNCDDWNRAMSYQEACIDLPGFMPSMNGFLATHFTDFIARLEPFGFRYFVIPGREWLNHKKNWPRDQRIFQGLVERAAQATKGGIIVLGTSSPKKHVMLSAAEGFIGSGWYIQAGKRLLLFGQRWVHVWQMNAPCCRAECCNGAASGALLTTDYALPRALHNLLEIQANLATTRVSIEQQSLALPMWS